MCVSCFGLIFYHYSRSYDIALYLVVACIGLVSYKLSNNGKNILIFIIIPIIAGAIFNVMADGYFWLKAYFLELRLVDGGVEVRRWIGFLNQPNNTGTLIVLGVIGLAYISDLLNERLFKFSFMVRIMLVAFSFFMGLSIVFIQSRTAALNIFILLFFAFVLRKFFSEAAKIIIFIAVISYFIGLSLFQYLPEKISVIGADGFGGRGLSSNLRLEIWTDLLGALWRRPWLGYGIGGTVHAFLAIEEPSVVYGTYFAHAHNIVLELLLWFGIPLGSVLVFIFGRSLWRIARHVNEKTILPAMMLMTLLVHAMLELPLHYAYFLIPMAIIWGWLSGQLPEQYRSKPVFTVSARAFSATALIVLVPALYVLSVTYLHHEQSLRQAKLEMAIKGWVAPAEPPPYPVLWELEALNDFVRVQDSDLFEPAQLQRFHEVVSVYPAKTMIHKAVAVFAHNGDTSRATYWRHKGCLIYAGDFCEKVSNDSSG